MSDIEENKGTVSSGFERGLLGIKKSAQDLGQFVGEATGLELLEDVSRTGSARTEQQLQDMGAGSDVTEISSVGEGVDFAQEAVGESAASMGAILSGAAVGSAFGPVGALIGGALVAFGLGAGEIAGTIEDIEKDTGVDVGTGTKAAAVLGGGAIIAAMDRIAPGKIFSKMAKEKGKAIAEESAKEFAKKLTVDGLKNAGTEGITEVGQEIASGYISSLATDTEYTLPDANELANIFAKGGVGGAGMSTGGAIISKGGQIEAELKALGGDPEAGALRYGTKKFDAKTIEKTLEESPVPIDEDAARYIVEAQRMQAIKAKDKSGEHIEVLNNVAPYTDEHATTAHKAFAIKLIMHTLMVNTIVDGKVDIEEAKIDIVQKAKTIAEEKGITGMGRYMDNMLGSVITEDPMYTQKMVEYVEQADRTEAPTGLMVGDELDGSNLVEHVKPEDRGEVENSTPTGGRITVRTEADNVIDTYAEIQYDLDENDNTVITGAIAIGQDRKASLKAVDNLARIGKQLPDPIDILASPITTHTVLDAIEADPEGIIGRDLIENMAGPKTGYQPLLLDIIDGVRMVEGGEIPLKEVLRASESEELSDIGRQQTVPPAEAAALDIMQKQATAALVPMWINPEATPEQKADWMELPGNNTEHAKKTILKDAYTKAMEALTITGAIVKVAPLNVQTMEPAVYEVTELGKKIRNKARRGAVLINEEGIQGSTTRTSADLFTQVIEEGSVLIQPAGNGDVVVSSVGRDPVDESMSIDMSYIRNFTSRGKPSLGASLTFSVDPEVDSFGMKDIGLRTQSTKRVDYLNRKAEAAIREYEKTARKPLQATAKVEDPQLKELVEGLNVNLQGTRNAATLLDTAYEGFMAALNPELTPESVKRHMTSVGITDVIKTATTDPSTGKLVAEEVPLDRFGSADKPGDSAETNRAALRQAGKSVSKSKAARSADVWAGKLYSNLMAWYKEQHESLVPDVPFSEYESMYKLLIQQKMSPDPRIKKSLAAMGVPADAKITFRRITDIDNPVAEATLEALKAHAQAVGIYKRELKDK